MASVYITRLEAENNLLPDICVFCGDPAVARPKHKFQISPGLTYVLHMLSTFCCCLGLAFSLAMHYVTASTVVLRLPVCTFHRRAFKFKYYIPIGATVLFFCIYGIIVVAINGQTFFDSIGLTVIALFGIMNAVLIYFAISVRVSDITGNRILITNVADKFQSTLIELRTEYDADPEGVMTRIQEQFYSEIDDDYEERDREAE